MTLASTLASLLERLRRSEGYIASTMGNVEDVLEIVRRLDRWLTSFEKKPEPTFVYVLPSDGAPMFARQVRVSRGSTQRIDFDNHLGEIGVKTWVVVAGPATVRAVRLGIQAQEHMTDFNGHVCYTVEPWHVGVRLSVELVS